MLTLVWLTAAFVAATIIYGVIVRVFERVRPLEHIGVDREALRMHLGEIARRGLKGARVIVEDMTSGRRVWVLKTYDRGKEVGFHMWAVLVDADGRGPIRGCGGVAGSLARALCVAGVPGYRRFRSSVAADCREDLNLLVQVVEDMFVSFHGVAAGSQFRLRVEGSISDLDLPVPISGKTTLREMLAFQSTCAKGIPYKQWHRIDVWFRAGEAFGRLLKTALDVLCLRRRGK